MPLSRPLLFVATLLLGSSLPALAQKLSVTPAPGLWEHSVKFTLNGQDMMATMRAAQAQALQQMQNLPPEQREMMMKMMQGAMGNVGGPQRSCVTPEQARAAADPEALMRQMTEEGDGAQDCRYQVQAVSGNTLKMTAQCRPQEGWNGTMNGTMTLHDAKRWTGQFQGKGRMQGELPPGLNAPGGAVEMVMDSSGRWLSADCGTLKPQR